VTKRQTPAGSPKGFQIYPELSPEEFAALRLSIATNGIIVPVEVDDDGNIVDGHHRVRAWTELRAEGVKVPEYERKVRGYANDDEKLEQALRLNQLRRHLTAEQRQEVVKELRKRGWSARRIADALDVGKSTVGRDLSSVPNGTVDTVTGLDGRQRPAHRPPTVAAFSTKEEERARAAMKELGVENMPSRPTRVGPLEKRVKAQRVLASGPPTGEEFYGAGWVVECTAIEDWEFDGVRIDLILTDPPYNEEGIESYFQLGVFAKKYLAPEGLVIAYLGKVHFREALEGLFENLKYVWLGVIVQNSRPSKIHAKKMDGGFRPYIVCSLGDYEPKRWTHDTIISPSDPEKDRHPWQQTLAPLKEIIEMHSDPGDVVCDPFLGSGTTGVAAISLGRDFLGCDIDPRSAKEASERLTEWELENNVS